MRALAAVALAAGLATQAAAQGMVTGTAFYRERIAPPPGAVFEAVLEDVSRADAPSVEIARDGGADRPGPPFAFALPYDPAAIDPAARYNVRARLLVDGRAMFTSDAAHPVITGGAPAEVEIAMRRAAEAPAPRGMRGMVTYFADAVRFVDCASGVAYPVAMEAELPALQQAVMAGRAAPETPILATIEGELALREGMEGGAVDSVVVHRFIAVWPALGCAQAAADASLTDTYWRILRLGALAPGVAEGAREPHLVLHAAEGRFAATVGCNQMGGGFETDGGALRFGQTASTLMACPPPLDAAERALAATLAATAGWRINGNALELFDAAGAPIALLEAVYLR